MKTSFRIVVPCALVLGFAAGAAQAQSRGGVDDRETWTESSKSQVWRNASGECWRSAFGPPPPPHLCGPAVAAYTPPPAPAPVVVAPPPQLPPQPVVSAAPPPPPAAAPAPYVPPPRRDRN
jgi:hypothetical protein